MMCITGFTRLRGFNVRPTDQTKGEQEVKGSADKAEHKESSPLSGYGSYPPHCLHDERSARIHDPRGVPGTRARRERSNPNLRDPAC